MQLLIALPPLWLAGLVLSSSGCAAGPQYFTPGENARGTRAEGHREALYQLRGKTGRFGEARVWSRGSVVTMLEGTERSVIHVGFELNNTGGAPLELRPSEVKLEVVYTDAGPLTDLSPHRATPLTVAPQTIGQLQTFFLLPAGIDPRDVRAFRLHWVVHGGVEQYQNNTPFVEQQRWRHDDHPHGYVIYDMHDPHYWHYRRLGYCYDIACHHVIVVPHRQGRVLPTRRTRVRP